MEGVVEYLMANPIFLAPLLLLVSVGIYALLKKLLKVARPADHVPLFAGYCVGQQPHRQAGWPVRAPAHLWSSAA